MEHHCEKNERIDDLHEALVQLTRDVSWLSRIGRWFIATSCTVLGVATTYAIPLISELHHSHDNIESRMVMVEGAVTSISNRLFNPGGSFKKDHRMCHDWAPAKDIN